MSSKFDEIYEFVDDPVLWPHVESQKQVQWIDRIGRVYCSHLQQLIRLISPLKDAASLQGGHTAGLDPWGGGLREGRHVEGSRSSEGAYIFICLLAFLLLKTCL